MGGSPHVILIQVLVPPHLDILEEDKEDLAKALISQTEQIIGPMHRRVVQGRVIFFLEGSEVYRLEEEVQ